MHEALILLSRIDEDAGLSDAELLEEARSRGEVPSALADAARKIMLEALSPHRVRFREESQVLAYQRFRPLLLLALSKLAAIGIGCSPADGIRLVREFFVNDWPDFGCDAGVERVVGGFLSYAHKTARFQLSGAGA
jgi:hypothetical protein